MEKAKLEKRFKELNDEYNLQVKELLNIKETLKGAEARVNTLRGQITELQHLYSEMFEKPKENAEEPIQE